MNDSLKKLSNNSYFQAFLALFAGALTPLAFSPWHLYPLSVLACALLLITWLSATPKMAAWRGLLYGIGMFGVGASWVYISIHIYGNTSALLAGVFTGGFVLLLALFPALQGYLLSRFFAGPSKLWLAFPTSWALFEWLRSWILSGFPWLIVGYSQLSSPLSGYIPILGEYGVTFLVTLSSALLVIAWRAGRRQRYQSLLLLIAIYALGYALQTIEWTKPLGKRLSVTMVQGDIPQLVKWQPNHLGYSLNTYLKLTDPHWRSDIIVWPESAIPASSRYMQDFLAMLNREASAHNSALLVGIPVEAEDGKHYYNALMGLGKAQGTYYKRHLVPFGEYLPFDRWLRGLIAFFEIPMSDFIPGHSNQSLVTVSGIPVAVSVCYEIAYAEIVRSHLPQSQLLVTISNDSWFGDSFAPWQHLEIGKFRSLQFGREQLFASNSGITALIDSKGHMQQKLPQFTSAALVGSVQPRVGSTPSVIIGTYPILLLLAIGLGLAAIGSYRYRKRAKIF